MLTALTIKNFTLVQTLEMDFVGGMTAITGETGAGKSLVLGALSMALGDRADTDRIRRGAERAEVSALFDINNIADAMQWLANHDFEHADDECLLRRIITREGRSRGTINGQPATMQQLRELGEMLIDIHSQHEHQSLLRRNTHRTLLDNYADTTALAAEVKTQHQNWHQLAQQLQQLEDQSEELSARKDLLKFQVEELNQLGLDGNEIHELEREQQLLANAEAIQQDSHAILDICMQSESSNLQDGLNQSLQRLERMQLKPGALVEAEKLLTSARIDIEEACREIQQHLNGFDGDPQRLQAVEDRLSAIYQLARKHRVQPDELNKKHQHLQQELDGLTGGAEDIDTIKMKLTQLAELYHASASRLSSSRQQAAGQFSKAVNARLSSLAMQGAQLTIQLSPLPNGEFSANGLESVELLIVTNPGEPARPLTKIASGGELSRISLAIQVVAAQSTTTPSLVFDEVDVGIGGATAEVVGKLLRELGSKGQVICVTHQPQVAACAHQHLHVSKQTRGNQAESNISILPDDARVEEIARMLGGANITSRTRDHAEEMLELARLQ